MLLRSASSPILNSLISVLADTSPGSASHLHLSSSSISPRSSSTTLMRAVSDSNISELLHPSIPKRMEQVMIIESGEEEAEHKIVSESCSFGQRQRRLLSCSGIATPALSLSPSLAVMDGCCSDTLVLDEGCVGDGGSGGRICGGGGEGGGGSEFFSDPDVYYQEMIQANPSDPLILGNYAKYLKEVRGDLVKAEEYCERAILASQEDGSVLSMYADIIWERSKDAKRAEAYFDRAVQAAPEDCYVAVSYARFLWDAEEEEEEQEEEQVKNETTTKGKEAVANSWTPPPFFPGQATTSPIAAAS